MTRQRRAECRVCGRDSAINQDEQVRPHNGSSKTGLLVSGRCPGSGRPPASEPPCDHSCGRTAGRVSYPPDLTKADLSQAHASVYVCFDPEHHAEAAQWVKSVTGHEGVFVEMKARTRV